MLSKNYRPSSPKCFKLDRQLGSGSFASVWLAHHEETNKQVAIKIIPKSSLKTDVNKARIACEAELHKKLNHPFIVPLFDHQEDIFNHFLILEYLPNRSLRDKMVADGPFPEHIARRYFVQIVLAVNYLHTTMNIVHRDLKADNIMIDEYDNIRLIDFGFSEQLQSEEQQMCTQCCSVRYAAPEILMKEPCTKKVDIWSLGIILFCMIAGHFPFESNDFPGYVNKVTTTQAPYPPDISFELLDLFNQMLRKDSTKRITISQVLEHPWVQHYYIPNIQTITVAEDSTLIDKIFKRECIAKQVGSLFEPSSSFSHLENPIVSRIVNFKHTTIQDYSSPYLADQVERLCKSGKFRPKVQDKSIVPNGRKSEPIIMHNRAKSDIY